MLRRGKSVRRFCTVPIGRKPTYTVWAVPRVECRRCGDVRQVWIGFADPRVSYTRSFKRYALELSLLMTILNVAMHLGIRGDVVKEMPIDRKMDQSRAAP
jgi:transposase